MSQFTNPSDAFQRLPSTEPANPTDQAAQGEGGGGGGAPMWDTGDVLMAAPRGAVDSVMGLYNTIDWAAQDVLPDWKDNPLGESKSVAGGLVAGLTEFGLLLIPGNAAVGAAGAAAKAGRFGALGAKALGWAAKATEAEKAAGGISTLVKGSARLNLAAAGASFLAATPGQERLSNLALQFDSPLLNNDITRYLASGEGESQLEARLKAAIESIPLGLATDAVFLGISHSIKAVRNGIVAGEKAAAGGATAEAAASASQAAEAAYAAEHAAEIRGAYENVAESVGSRMTSPDAEMSPAGLPKADTSAAPGGVPQFAVKDNRSVSEIPELQSALQQVAADIGGSAERAAPRKQSDWLVSAIESSKSVASKERNPRAFSSKVAQELRSAAEAKYGPYRDASGEIAWPDDVLDAISRAESGGIKPGVASQAVDASATKDHAALSALKKKIDKVVKEGGTVQDVLNIPELAENKQALAGVMDGLSSAGVRVVLNDAVLIGGSARETLDHLIATGHLSETDRRLASLILERNGELLDKVPVRFHKNPEPFAVGRYDPKNREIAYTGDGSASMRTPKGQAKTGLHEVVHAATYAKINAVVLKDLGEAGLGNFFASGYAADITKSGSAFRESIGKIKDKNVRTLMESYVSFVESLKGGDKAREAVYGASNFHEFVAESLSNPELRSMLTSIKAPDGRSLLRRITDAIAELLGVSEIRAAARKEAGQVGDEATLLDVVMREGAELVARPSPESGANIAGVRLLSKDVQGAAADASFAGRPTGRQEAPIPNTPRPKNVVDMRPEIADLIRSVRTGQGGWTPQAVAELEALIQKSTDAGLENLGFGHNRGNQSADFMLAMSEAVNQNKDIYESLKEVRTNRMTADAAADFIDYMAVVGGMTPEQRLRFVATVSDWHGPMFQDGAAIADAFLGEHVRKLLDATAKGASAEGERAQLYAETVAMMVGRRKIGALAGRTLQNRKMFWDEAFAYQVKNMTPQEVQARIELLKNFRDIGVIDKETFFRLRDGGFTNAGGVGIATWMFKNSILSGPATSAVNAISGVASHLYLPLERASGEMLLGGATAEGRARALRELRVYRGYMMGLNDVWNQMRASWKQEGDSITLGSGTSPFGEFQTRRPVSADNPAIAKPMAAVGIPAYRFDPASNTNQRTVWGAAVEWIGKASGVPVRVMGTIDEGLSSVYARAEARLAIIDAAPASIKGNPKELARFVEDMMGKAFDDVGALYSEDAVRSSLMRAAKARGFEPGSPEWVTYVQNGMAQKWVSPQGQDRFDMEFLKRVSEKVRKRTEYGTFKREYDEIVDGNTFAPSVVGNLGMAASGLVRHLPAAGLILPFVKTPTNLAAWALERNPTAAGAMLKRQWANPEMRGEVAGRLAAGSVFYGSIISLAMSGNITGRGPTDPNVRKALIDSGWQPNSIRVGDSWVSYARLDPFATIFGMAADLVEISSHRYSDKEFLNASDAVAKVAIGTIANNLVNKTYLAGLKSTLDAIMAWEQKGPQFLRQYGSSMVPNFMAQSSMVSQDDMAAPKSLIDAIRARIPGLGDTVDRQRNALGEAMENNAEPWNLAVPTRVSQETNDPVRKELASLLVGFAPPDPQLPGGVNLTDYRSPSGQSAYDRYQELTSEVRLGGRTLRERLNQVIGSPAYQRMPSSSVDGVQTSRVSVIRSDISRYRREAMRRLQSEYPELGARSLDVKSIKARMLRGT